MSISNVDGGHFEIQDGLIGASRHLLHARSFIKTNIASETNQKSLKASKNIHHHILQHRCTKTTRLFISNGFVLGRKSIELSP